MTSSPSAVSSTSRSDSRARALLAAEGEAKGTQRLRKALAGAGWPKFTFTIEKRINNVPLESVSHEIDHVRTFERGARIALKIEWNNKDPFYDRDQTVRLLR
jgi:hypothetical protein